MTPKSSSIIHKVLWEQKCALPISVLIRLVHWTSTFLLIPYVVFQHEYLWNRGFDVANYIFIAIFGIYYLLVCIPPLANLIKGKEKLFFVELLTCLMWFVGCFLVAFLAFPGDCDAHLTVTYPDSPTGVCGLGEALIVLTAVLFIASLYAVYLHYRYVCCAPWPEKGRFHFGGIFLKYKPEDHEINLSKETEPAMARSIHPEPEQPPVQPKLQRGEYDLPVYRSGRLIGIYRGGRHMGLAGYDGANGLFGARVPTPALGFLHRFKFQ